jgi:hypothetical protein
MLGRRRRMKAVLVTRVLGSGGADPRHRGMLAGGERL